MPQKKLPPPVRFRAKSPSPHRLAFPSESQTLKGGVVPLSSGFFSNPDEGAFDALIPAPTPGSMSKPPLLAVAFRLESN